MRFRLSLLLFLLFAIPGAWVPQVSLWLEHELRLAPTATGLIGATHALGAILAPLIAGQVADRWIAPERCVAASCLAAGILLWFLAALTTPLAIFFVSLIVWLLLTSALTLGTAYTLASLASPESDYGSVRLWGTVGWMTSLWLIGFWLREDNPSGRWSDAPRLASLFALAAGCYAVTLPRSIREVQAATWLAPLAALRLLRFRSFAVACAGNFGVALTMAYAGQAFPLFLNYLDFKREWIPPTQTLAQIAEVLNLALLPAFLLRLDVRGTMTFGLVVWTLALCVWTVGQPQWLVVAALANWGVVVCCYFVAAQVFVNRLASGDFRASAQGLLTFVNGLGMLAGYLLGGWVRQATNTDFTIVFLVDAAIAAIFTLLFLFGFSGDEATVRAP
jgi:MFS family permease